MADKAAGLAKAAGTDRERSLIHALQLRYKDGGGGKPGDLTFAKTMATLAAQCSSFCNGQKALLSAAGLCGGRGRHWQAIAALEGAIQLVISRSGRRLQGSE